MKLFLFRKREQSKNYFVPLDRGDAGPPRQLGAAPHWRRQVLSVIRLKCSAF
jgi:hypothetical protein